MSDSDDRFAPRDAVLHKGTGEQSLGDLSSSFFAEITTPGGKILTKSDAVTNAKNGNNQVGETIGGRDHTPTAQEKYDSAELQKLLASKNNPSITT